MKQFLGKNFLLTTETAKTLYHDYAADMPIVDYHCHINPQVIAEDKKYTNITQVWLGGDHYKWRLMRSNGIDEKYITGDASDYDKFQKWAETLPKAIGNPLYHWSHLELQRYFDYDGLLNPETADKVWHICNNKLKQSNMTVKNIIKQSNVQLLCTTDDPADSLEWHKMIAEDKAFDVKVLPAFRPDKGMNLEKTDYIEYINKLAVASRTTIHDFSSLCDALRHRLTYFASMGCRISDHALEYVMFQPASESEIEEIFSKRLTGIIPNEKEQLQFKTAYLMFLGKEYHKLGWVMQLHYGTLRNVNTASFIKLGSDTGYDCINSYSSSEQMAAFLSALHFTDELPKTIIYSLNPNDIAAIETVVGSFQSSATVGKIRQGAAWWFNDHKAGMTQQMISLANHGLFANYLGMLTDSRSFLSYTRHEYFRRILCEFIGNLVEAGEYPNYNDYLGRMVQDISYNNCMKYFDFK